MENSNQKNIEEYIKKYVYTAKNLKGIFLRKIPRNINKKIPIDWYIVINIYMFI